MPKEIERKFLVIGDFRRSGQPVLYRQGYLNTDPLRTVRVRCAGDNAWLTVKGKTVGFSRDEFEYPIPITEAKELIGLCEGSIVEKYRHMVESGGLTWEVDEFRGENEGLVIAEIELESEGVRFTLPDWTGREVTGDLRFYNSNLSECPYRQWIDSGVIIFHLTTRRDLESARAAGSYTAPSLEDKGFIHCSRASQVADTANLLFAGRDNLIVLHIDTTLVDADIRYEEPAHEGHGPDVERSFPHIYGPLNLEAVAGVEPLRRTEDGSFRFTARDS